jgi:hypothetical protein
MTSPRITGLPKPKKSNATSRKKRTPRGRAPAPMPQVPENLGEMKGPIGKIKKLKPRKRVKKTTPAPMPEVSFDKPGKIKGGTGKIRKLKPGKAGIGLSPVKRKKNNKKAKKVSNKGKMVLF